MYVCIRKFHFIMLFDRLVSIDDKNKNNIHNCFVHTQFYFVSCKQNDVTVTYILEERVVMHV